MFIIEKGLDIPSTEIDLRSGEQMSAEFLKINPNATVPVLETDDGAYLTTTTGCRTYLESVHPEPALLGKSSTEKGLVADAVARIESDGLLAIAECLRNTAKGMKDRALTGPRNYAQNAELGMRGRERATAFFSTLNAMIADKPFVVGNQFSAADIDAFIFCEFVKWIKVEMPEDCANVARWHATIAARDSAQA